MKVVWEKIGRNNWKATINGKQVYVRRTVTQHSRSYPNKFGFGSYRVRSSTTLAWVSIQTGSEQWERVRNGERESFDTVTKAKSAAYWAAHRIYDRNRPCTDNPERLE
jgi:hypothetical protein